MQGINSGREHTNEGLKPAARIVPLLIAVLLAGALFFYKERMLFIDAPHVLFRIINDGSLFISDQRYGSFVTQMVPLISSKLHLPLKLTMILYSASFYLFYLTVALLLVYKFRNYGLAILFGLYLTLFVGPTYYWPNNEVHQGIGWLLLAFGANQYYAEKNISFLPGLLLFTFSVWLAIWTHPLVMLAAVYLWVFLWLAGIQKVYTNKQMILYTLLLLVISGLKFYQGMNHGYDSSKIEVVTHFEAGRIAKIFSSPQLLFFARGCVTHYWLFVLVFVAGLAALLKERRYLLFAWTLVYAIGYLVLVCITFWDVSSNRFYIESEYMPLSLICAAPFVYFVLPLLRADKRPLLLLLLFCVRIVYIYSASLPFTARVDMLYAITEKMKQKNVTKVVIPEQATAADEIFIMKWALPVESIFMSRLRGEVPQRTFVFMNDWDMKMYHTNAKDTMSGCYEKRSVSNINSRYLVFDTGSVYVTMTFDELMQ